MRQSGHIQFSLRLLGSPALASAEGAPVVGLGPGKPLAMLAYLAVRREARREELLELLWGGVAEERARNAFRQALHRLRTALGEDIIPQDRERVSLGASDLIEIDRDLFSAAADQGAWTRAVELYRGDFLQGIDVGEPAFERWVESERARLRSVAEDAYRRAAQQAMDEARWPEATRLAAQLSALTPFDENTAALEATILAAAGRPNEALGVLHRYEARLRTDLDLESPPAIRALVARLAKSARSRTPDESAAGGSSRRRVAFVGRETELARLLALVRGLRSEQGATAVIEGAAGIGKTRLADELIDRAAVLGRFRVARGREAAMRGAVPFASVAEALRGLADAPGVGGTSRHLLAEAARLVPELLDAFDMAPAPPVIDEAARLRFFEGVAALVDAVAYEQPVLLILDDLQHASASTVDLITYLSQRLRHSPVLLLLVTRDDAAAQGTRQRIAALAGTAVDPDGHDAPPTLALGPLHEDETKKLVEHILNGRANLEAELDRVAALASGHPERAFEIARRAVGGETLGALPASMRGIMWARLQSASPAQRRVFFAAALLERSCSLRLLAVASHLPESATLEAADRLEQLRLLSQDATGYRVAHDSTSAFVLDASGAAGRALLASWAADALSREADAAPAELASLYAIAGQAREAFRQARAACYAAAAAGVGNDVMQLGAIALTFAPDENARREIEALLVPFGGAAVRDFLLPAGPAAEAATERPVGAAEETRPEAPTEPARPTPAVYAARRPFGLRELQLLLVAAIVVSAGMLLRQRVQRSAGHRVLTDSLVVMERESANPSRKIIRTVTGALDGALDLRAAQRPAELAWVDLLQVPWINPHASPDGRTVAVERVTVRGPEVYVMRGSPRDTVRLPGSGGSDIALGWSPDGRSLLFARGRTLPDGSYAAGLYAYQLGTGAITPVDTARDRSVTDAAWAPNGLWIAYVARAGESRQQDIFVSRPDGSERRNLTRDPSEDDEPAWSPDASLLAFTSTRGGERHVYVYDFLNDRIWTAAAGAGVDQHPSYSLDGKYLAFESTRDGDAAVYVTLPIGGTATRVTPAGHQYALQGWRGRNAPFVDVVRIVGSTSLPPRDTASFSVLALDNGGSATAAPGGEWRVVDTSVARFVRPPDGGTVTLQTLHAGNERVIAAWPGWRADTLDITVGASRSATLSDDFSAGIRPGIWRLFGRPKAVTGHAPGSNAASALFPNADLEWASGALSVAAVDIRRALSVSARAYAPFGGRSMQAANLEIALVAAVPDSAIATAAPEFSPFVSLNWNGESGRITYAIGQQTFSESAADLGTQPSHVFGITVGADGGVVFAADGKPRWRSSTHFLGGTGDLRARLWLGGRATYQWGAFSDVKLEQR